MSVKEHKYKKGPITVVWKPKVCIHASRCWKELPEVFNPKGRPWINTDGASVERLKEQLNRCPSGALSYIDGGEGSAPEGKAVADAPPAERAAGTANVVVEVTPNGPLLLSGALTIQSGGESSEHEQAALCRCGSSGNKPFCDGSHTKSGFKG